VFRILVELREAFANIVDKQLGEIFIALKHIAEELAVVVVHHVRKFFLEWEGLQLLPSHFSLVGL
jgi:hypothetical protein